MRSHLLTLKIISSICGFINGLTTARTGRIGMACGSIGGIISRYKKQKQKQKHIRPCQKTCATVPAQCKHHSRTMPPARAHIDGASISQRRDTIRLSTTLAAGPSILPRAVDAEQAKLRSSFCFVHTNLPLRFRNEWMLKTVNRPFGTIRINVSHYKYSKCKY